MRPGRASCWRPISTLEIERPRSVDRRYYDTFDGRLHGEGLTLVHEDGTLVLLDRSGNPRSVAEHRTAPRKLFAGELSGGPAAATCSNRSPR